MEEIGKYKISDLVKLTELPRTTITDWLERYAPYLTYSTLGKRRLYSERTLEIIKEIVTLRDAGKSSQEIDQTLASKYPVRPEEVTSGTGSASAAAAAAAEDEEGDENHAGEAAPRADEHGLIARRQADEVARLISGQLQAIAQRLESLEKQQQQLPAPAAKPFNPLPWVLAVLLLVALAVGGYLAVQEIRQLQTENRRIAEQIQQRDNELKQRDDELRNRDRQLENITVNLDKAGKDYQRNMEKLQQDLSKQQKEFQQQIEKMAADGSKTREAVLLQLRENLTAERLALLKQLDNPELSKEQKAGLMRQLDELGRKTEAAIAVTEQGKTPVAAPATPVPAPADKK